MKCTCSIGLCFAFTPLQVTKVDRRDLALWQVKQQKVAICGWGEGQFLPFDLDPALSLFVNRLSEASWTTIAIKAQPSIYSGHPASRQYSLADTVHIILNESPPENQVTANSDSANSDSGEEIDAQVESSFNPNDTTDSNSTGSLSPSPTGSFQLHCG